MFNSALSSAWVRMTSDVAELSCSKLSVSDIIYSDEFAMNNQQLKTLELVFATPVNGNLEWRKIEALLMAVGCVRTEGSGSSVGFMHSGVTVRFHRPHPQREALRYRVLDARGFLKAIGITP